MRALKEAGFAVSVVVTFSAALLAVQAVPPLAVVPFFLWPFAFILDATVTWKVYRISPSTFEGNEANRVLVALTQHVKMPHAIVVHFLAVEMPLFAFISFVVAPLLGAFFAGSASTLSCLSAGAAVLAFAHAYGWRETAKTAEGLETGTQKGRVRGDGVPA